MSNGLYINSKNESFVGNDGLVKDGRCLDCADVLGVNTEQLARSYCVSQFQRIDVETDKANWLKRARTTCHSTRDLRFFGTNLEDKIGTNFKNRFHIAKKWHKSISPTLPPTFGYMSDARKALRLLTKYPLENEDKPAITMLTADICYKMGLIGAMPLKGEQSYFNQAQTLYELAILKSRIRFGERTLLSLNGQHAYTGKFNTQIALDYANERHELVTSSRTNHFVANRMASTLGECIGECIEIIEEPTANSHDNYGNVKGFVGELFGVVSSIAQLRSSGHTLEMPRFAIIQEDNGSVARVKSSLARNEPTNPHFDASIEYFGSSTHNSPTHRALVQYKTTDQISMPADSADSAVTLEIPFEHNYEAPPIRVKRLELPVYGEWSNLFADFCDSARNPNHAVPVLKGDDLPVRSNYGYNWQEVR